MPILPSFPIWINPIGLLGLILLLGLIGGELARRSRILPIITGYIAVGFLVGPGAIDIVTPSLLAQARIFVDISLGLILFDLGRHLDLTWIRHDKGLLRTSLAECTITFISILLVMLLFHLSLLSAALAACIAVITSPAEVMMVAHDLAAEGPVTRRTLVLTSLNNLFGLTIFILLLPVIEPDTGFFTIIFKDIYRLTGSFALGIVMFYITRAIAQFIGKYQANQFVLFSGVVILTIGLAQLLNLSSMLTLFILGAAARNLDFKHILVEVDFGWLARLFFILLFFITGVQLKLTGLWNAMFAILMFIFIRTIAKFTGIKLFSKKSRLTSQQVTAISLALTPMAALAIGMSHKIMVFNPNLDDKLLIIIPGVVAILNIIGPILTQLAFIKTGESASTERQPGNLI